MKDITIIVPVINHEDPKMKELRAKAFSSIKELENNEGEVILVGSQEVLDTIDEPSFKKVVNTGSTNFAAQVNLAVKNCKSKYFTILEEDDLFSRKWFNDFKEYEGFYKDTSLFMPLTEIINYADYDKGSVGYVNEVVWASSFTKEIGFIDLECLKNFMEFNLTGAIFNRNDFVSVGGLKESMKLSYWYEFLMRFINNEKKAFVVPKVGYFHVLNRPDSVSVNYSKEMKQEEADWWIDLAQKEYLYKKDRNKTYEE